MTELRKIRQYNITNIREDVEKIWIFTLSPVTADSIPKFVPGQFVNLHLNDSEGKPIFRPYSIASAPLSDELEFCIKIHDDGKFSNPLSKKKTGDRIGVSGPFGFLTYENQEKAVFAAAGTGIAPIMSMLRQIVAKNIHGDFLVFYSNKFKNSIIYKKELLEMAKKHPDIKIVLTLTQEEPADWVGEKGRICDPMIKKYLKDGSEYNYYFCGPLEFIKSVKECVLSLGAKAEKIKIEGWG